MNDLNDRYDRTYYENILTKTKPNAQRTRQGLNELLSYKQGGKLFEIGCGKGEFLKLAANYFDVAGIDISSYATGRASAALNGRIRQGNIEDAPVEAEEFDAIAAFNVLEHLHNPADVIAKLYRGLCSHGVLIGSVPLNYGFFGSIHTLLTNIGDRTHVSTYRPARWQKLFQDTGFRLICLFGEVTIGKNRNIYVRNRYWPYLSFNLMFVCQK